MKKTRKLWIAALVCTVMLTLAAGCGSSSTTSSTDKDKDYVIKLGYYNCDHMVAACVAKDAGIYKDLGLNVEVTGNGKVPEAMAAGQMDAGYIGTDGLMFAHMKGSPIFVAANNHISGSYYIVASNNIKTPADLVGKKLAIDTEAEKKRSQLGMDVWKTGNPR